MKLRALAAFPSSTAKRGAAVIPTPPDYEVRVIEEPSPATEDAVAALGRKAHAPVEQVDRQMRVDLPGNFLRGGATLFVGSFRHTGLAAQESGRSTCRAHSER